MNQRGGTGNGGEALKLGGDHAVIPRGRGKNFARKIEPGDERSITVALQFSCDAVVVCRIGDHGHTFPIFRSRAQHCGPADIDVFDQLVGG